MTPGHKPAPQRAVLRYTEDWAELRAQLDDDRAAGLASSAVRDAVARWLDDDTFVEVGSLVRRASSSYRGGDEQGDEQPTTVPADGLIAGWGRNGGRLVFVAADDPTLGSTIRGEAAAGKAARVRAHALEQSAPLLQILGSQRLDPAVFVGAEFVRYGYGVDLDFESQSADRILKVGIVTAALTEQAALEAGSCHLRLMIGPDAALHGFGPNEALARGFADVAVDDLTTALRIVGEAVAHLPSNCFDGPPTTNPIVEHTADRCIDGDIEILDAGWSFELAPHWCPRLRARLGRVGGLPAGLVDCSEGTVFDAATASKALRIARYCSAFALPLVVAHSGLNLPVEPMPSDVAAVDALRGLFRSPRTTVLEVARSKRSLASDLGVRALWSVGTDPNVSWDAVVSPQDRKRACADAVALLRPARIRVDQDERIQRREPRTLGG